MNKSLSAREVIKKACHSLSSELKGCKFDIHAISEVSTCWEGKGYMKYHEAYILRGAKGYWGVCLGEHDKSVFTKQYDCDLTVIRILGPEKKFIVSAIEQAKWFSKSLMHATRDNVFHFNLDNYPKHIKILETKMRENLIRLDVGGVRYKESFPNELHGVMRKLVTS